MNRVKELAAVHKIITVSEVPDNCAVNCRKKAFTATQLPPNVLYTPIGCCAHLLNRIIAVASREEKLVGHCHAVWTVTHSPAHFDKLSGVVRDTVAEDFDWLPGPAPVDHSAHLRAIFEHTILRRLDHTAGSLIKEVATDNIEGEGSDSEDGIWNRRRQGVALCLKFCQSDPRGTRIVHYCLGCCSSREEALDNTTAAIMQAGLIKGFSSITPSKGRHGSTTEALGEQSAGMMVYSILPRVFQKAFPNWRAMDQQAEGDDDGGGHDGRQYMRGKTYRSTKYLSSKRDRMMATLLSWASEACDYLWMRLQYLDARHSTLVDSVMEKRSPFIACTRQLCQALLSPLDEGPLQTVFLHWGLDDPDGMWLAGECRCTLISMVCQLHWRFISMFRTWPFKLAQVGEPGVSDTEILTLFEKLYEEPECCLDKHFAAKLRGLAVDAKSMCDAAEIMGGLRLWARHTKLANMITERLLARCKASTPDKYPVAERLVATSFLTQWVHAHKSATGVDPRKSQARADLLRRNVPLAAGRRSRRRVRKPMVSRSRGVWTYVKQHRLKVKMSYIARRAESSRLANEFYNLSLPERAQFVVHERSKQPEAIPEDPDDKYTRLVGGSLFGLSSREEAYMEHEFEKIIDSIVPEGRGQGMRNYAHLLRKRFASKLVVSDVQAIPPKLRLPECRPCALLHPGLCPHKTPAIFERGLGATERFIVHIIKNGSVGQVIYLSGDGGGSLLYGLIGYIRLKRPSQVVALALQHWVGDDGQEQLRLSTSDEDPMMLCPMFSSEIIASALTRAGHTDTLKVSFVGVSWQLRHAGQCQVLEVGDSIDLLEVPAGEAAAPAVEAAPAGVGMDADLASVIAAGFQCLPGMRLRPRPARAAKARAAKFVKEGDNSDSDSDEGKGSSSASPDEDGDDKGDPVVDVVAPEPLVVSVAAGPHVPAPSIDDDEFHDAPFEEFVKCFRRGPSSSISKGSSSSSSGALPAPPPPPPPVLPAGAGVRPKGGGVRPNRSIAWGPFTYASVWCNGIQIGWGATCGMHHNPDDGEDDTCKKMITYGKQELSDQACILQLKRWLHRGYHLTPAELGESPRHFHVKKVDARSIGGPDEVALDDWVQCI